MKLPGFPKVHTLGHRRIQRLLDGEVVVQEKLDGSQVSFGIREGQLFCRSKGVAIDLGQVPNLFAPAVATAIRLHEEGKLTDGWTYRGEALCRPKHNTLAYSRAPEAGLVLFDIDRGPENRMKTERELRQWAEHLGLESVPYFYQGAGHRVTKDMLDSWLERESMLGGAKIEGVVIKNYDRFNEEDGKQLMGKYVSEAFKEAHRGDWKVRNPGRTDVVTSIIESYATERRWEKAVERMRDDGRLLGEPKDIGPLIGEVAKDVLEECGDEIRDALMKYFWKQIAKGVTNGLAEWYKGRLNTEFVTREFCDPAAGEEVPTAQV